MLYTPVLRLWYFLFLESTLSSLVGKSGFTVKTHFMSSSALVEAIKTALSYSQGCLERWSLMWGFLFKVVKFSWLGNIMIGVGRLVQSLLILILVDDSFKYWYHIRFLNASITISSCSPYFFWCNGVFGVSLLSVIL